MATVMSIVGARPQFVKLAPVAQAFASSGYRHLIVDTGQHYDWAMAGSFFQALNIPEPAVSMGIGSGTHGVQTGAILAGLDAVLLDARPDAVLVFGDTNSTLAGALAAVKMHIPLVHLEAGLRSRNRTMPEEHNRVLTDHAADLCLAPTELAMQNLANEGLAARAILVGDVMTDVCLRVRDRMMRRPERLAVVEEHEPFLFATIHRAENTDDSARLRAIIGHLSDLDMPVVLAAHPRLKARAGEFGIDLATNPRLRVIDPLAYPALISAVLGSRGVITDSGGLQKEAFLLERVCTTLRTETEWPETLEGGWNILDPDLDRMASLAARGTPPKHDRAPFGDGDASSRVVSAIGSLVDA